MGDDARSGPRAPVASLLLAGLLGAASCQGPDDGQAGAPPTPEPADLAGTYEATLEDGKVIRQTLNADGTYEDVDSEGNPVESGTWRINAGELCYDPEGSEPEACYAGGPAGSVRTVGTGTKLPAD